MNVGKNTVIALSLFVFLICAGLIKVLSFPSQIVAQSASEKENIIQSIESTLKKFVRKDVNGLTRKISSKKYVLYFWSNWCSECLEDLKKISKMKDKDVIFLTFNISSSDKEIKEYLKKNKLSVVTFKDKENSLMTLLEAKSVPSYVFIENYEVKNIVEPKGKNIDLNSIAR